MSMVFIDPVKVVRLLRSREEAAQVIVDVWLEKAMSGEAVPGQIADLIARRLRLPLEHIAQEPEPRPRTAKKRRRAG